MTRSERRRNEPFISVNLRSAIFSGLYDWQVDLADTLLSRMKFGKFPDKEVLRQVNLTERSLFLLSSLYSVPGGAAAPIAVNLWKRQVENHGRNIGFDKPLYIIAGTHEDFPIVNPDDSIPYSAAVFNSNKGYHAERSCGIAMGDSRTTRSLMLKNMEEFNQWLKKNTISNVHLLPIITYPGERVGFGYDPVQYADIQQTTGLSVGFSLGVQNNTHLSLISGEVLDMQLRSIVEHEGHIAGVVCSDQRMGFCNPPDSTDRIRKADLRTIYDLDNLRDDWQLSIHGESCAVIIPENDSLMHKVVYSLVATPSLMVRDVSARPSTLWMNESYPFMIRVPSDLGQRETHWLQMMLTNLISSMDSEAYGGAFPYSPFSINTPVIYQKKRSVLHRIEMGKGLQVISRQHDQELVRGIRPGLLIFPGSPVYPDYTQIPFIGKRNSLGPII